MNSITTLSFVKNKIMRKYYKTEGLIGQFFPPPSLPRGQFSAEALKREYWRGMKREYVTFYIRLDGRLEMTYGELSRLTDDAVLS